MLTAGMRENSVAQYRRAIAAFLVFLAFNAVEPEEPCEYDDLLCEYQAFGNNGGPVARSHFTALIAGIERVLPHLKGTLEVSHAVLASWSVSFTPKHTLPLSKSHAILLAARMATLGFRRPAALLLLQYGRGLRPGEALSLRACDVILPHEVSAAGGGLLLLGARSGTKSKRPQVVRVTDRILLHIMALFRGATAADQRLTGIRTLGGYNYIIARTKEALGLAHVPWTGHSARAGFVTDQYLSGTAREIIAGVTRHQSLRTLQSYLDATSVAAGQFQHEYTKLAPLVEWAKEVVMYEIGLGFAS